VQRICEVVVCGESMRGSRVGRESAVVESMRRSYVWGERMRGSCVWKE